MALANLRLVFSCLPRLDAPQDLQRLKAAEILFDAGLTTDHVLGVIGLDDLGKDVANEPRVPPGNGRQSGEWTSSLWSRFSAWLDEEVPVYDQDTGTQVGTQSRARAIATSPLAVGAAGTAAPLGRAAGGRAGNLGGARRCAGCGRSRDFIGIRPALPQHQRRSPRQHDDPTAAL